MFVLSKKSLDNLKTCEMPIIQLFTEVIHLVDFSVIFGYRTPEEQFEIWKEGRKEINGKWHVMGDIRTYKDGYNELSNHNYYPSRAIDVMPYPID